MRFLSPCDDLGWCCLNLSPHPSLGGLLCLALPLLDNNPVGLLDYLSILLDNLHLVNDYLLDRLGLALHQALSGIVQHARFCLVPDPLWGLKCLEWLGCLAQTVRRLCL